MGWWKIQGTETVIGDLPLETLAEALETVFAMYREELERDPTRDELAAMIDLELQLVFKDAGRAVRPVVSIHLEPAGRSG